MELRQLEAFVAVATELHFGRAADRLRIGQPTLSDLIRRLERELGAPLLTRTTRKVALTGAGQELLGRAKVILDEVAAAAAAVRRTAQGETGTVRVAITPPAAPVLAPHLNSAACEHLPDVDVAVQRMWLPDLTRALAEGTTDVAITCARLPDVPGVVNTVFCSEPLLVGLRPDHHLAGDAEVALGDLERNRLAFPSDTLFPALALAQRQALDSVGLTPPVVVLDTTDLSASNWTNQLEATWILLTASLGTPPNTTVLPIVPALRIPYTLQWSPERAQTAAVARFVRLALTHDVPPGWHLEPGHLRHPG
ncbi:LysR family transcriptional regulator [Mycolicibacterium hodleri]|uniref:Probable hydrogen peroxide-inducible genes activator n=1 Tax=Mycolicibacterium hodleri TaxID=49897 RepID=A0A502EB58_9MYCO|nr:LysR family transcriptional regulator [Mycolicibacterium hodleri]TPG34965.1 LysR family transcriptional regulator [Mycolicibacterium hodleri]